MTKIRLVACFILMLVNTLAYCQGGNGITLSIRSDSLEFSTDKNSISVAGEPYLYFLSNEQQPLLTVYVKAGPENTHEHLSLLSSDDYFILDSLKHPPGGLYVGRVKLNDIISVPKPALGIKSGNNAYQFKLLPIVIPVANPEIKSIEAFQEEQKTIEIPATNGYNIKTDNTSVVGKDFDYQLSSFLNFLVLTIRPHTIGAKQLCIPLKSILPVLDKLGNITNNIQTLTLNLNVKPFKLSYINFDQNTLFYSFDSKGSQQIVADYNPLFEQGKTFRIEDRQTSGGTLVAELYIESLVDNNKKAICRLKPFSFHKMADGYLYIKDGEKNRFICNISICEKPKIEKISIRKNGDDWDDGLTVHPGEFIEIRIQGRGLQTNKIRFDGIDEAKLDTIKSSDEAVFFQFKVPASISNKHITVFLDRKETSYQLNVKNYLKPARMDFISINYGQTDISLGNSRFNKPVFYDSIIKDINFTFDPNKIDVGDNLYGKQYINMEIRLLNKENDLIEIEKIENIVVCPGDKSPRKGHYDQSDCNEGMINLNDYLDHKTYKLPAFTQVIITISHDESKYEDAKPVKKKIKFILVRKFNYDLQLSFPTGLLVKDFGKGGGIGDLSGISASVLFNITPYEEKEPGKLRPYSIGAGFLALNALNLGNNSSSDLGIVIMGTVQPFRKNAKFSVPIYFGYGYFVKSGKFFEILGPGLQFNF
ncbi:MAG: hypothetical protein ACHQRM_16280 [Bacteroidia bacterium]